jgi:hypothetical protein
MAELTTTVSGSNMPPIVTTATFEVPFFIRVIPYIPVVVGGLAVTVIYFMTSSRR